MKNSQSNSGQSRRSFLKTTAVAGALSAGMAIPRMAHAQGSDTISVGLIGCGGRGTGAASNALNADPGVRITAMADAFGDRLEGSLNGLKKRYEDRITVTDETKFVGLESYKQLLETGVDVVLLATPPYFRPAQLAAAVDAGCHVFCEKPVAVDAPGVRSVMETSAKAEEKGLSLVSGLCWRYHNGVKETMQQVFDGAIGDIIAIRESYNTGFLWQRPRQEGWTDMEYQMRNWLYYTWLSGDHIVEQAIHSLDKGSWAMGDVPPVKAFGLGGRQVRTDPKYGNIYDHHAICYEYENGVQLFFYCRQQGGCANQVKDIFMGTKGQADILGHRIRGENEWRFRGDGGNMYDLEHQALFGAIRSGEPINNGKYMALSTMLAIMGRMCCYTGAELKYEDALASTQDLSPAKLAMDAEPPIMPGPDGAFPIAMPGLTKFE